MSPRKFAFLPAILVTFLKEKNDRQCRTIGGIGDLQTVVQSDESVEKHLVCPDEHVERDVPDVTAPNTAGSSSGVVVPPQPGVLNRLDVHLGIGYEFDNEGHLCRRDVINRLYRVDEYGKNHKSLHYLPSSPL